MQSHILDVHKDTIAVSLAQPGREEPRYFGEIANTRKAMEKLVNRLSRESGGAVLQWCYEAGPCGYVLYRQLLELGQDCEVVAPTRWRRLGCWRNWAICHASIPPNNRWATWA